MGLYQEHRPDSIYKIVGNAALKQVFLSYLKTPHTFPQVWLFTGMSGCGKTTFARAIAKDLGISNNDTYEMDNATDRGIDTVRRIIEMTRYKPTESKYKVFILDECHKFTNEAQNALLKLTEDTPKHVIILMCSTDPQKLITTLRGRTKTVEVKPLNQKELTTLLVHIAKKEDKEISTEICELIYKQTEGQVRNAIQLLDMALSTDGVITEELISNYNQTETASFDLCRALISRSWNKCSKILAALKEQKTDPEGVRRMVLGYAQAILLRKADDTAALMLEAFMEPNFTNGFPQLVLSSYTVCSN